MATDLEQIVLNLSRFYDFKGRTVLEVGAGGGQLVDYLRDAEWVIAVDRDLASLDRLSSRLEACGVAGKFGLFASDWLDVHRKGDVVVFEFCLHLMEHPARALAHAFDLAPEVLVVGHAPGSPWSWCAAENRGVEACWKAVDDVGTRRIETVEALQRFADYAELEDKLASQPFESRERIASYRSATSIEIPMPYRMALLSRP